MVSLKHRFGGTMLWRFRESFKWSLTYNEARMPTFLLYFKGDLGHNGHGWLLQVLLVLLFVGGRGCRYCRYIL
jgi:hypothetical protein